MRERLYHTLINHTFLLVQGEVTPLLGSPFESPPPSLLLILWHFGEGGAFRGELEWGRVLLGVGISENSSDVLGLGRHTLTSGSHLDGTH